MKKSRQNWFREIVNSCFKIYIIVVIIINVLRVRKYFQLCQFTLNTICFIHNIMISADFRFKSFTLVWNIVQLNEIYYKSLC